MSKVRPRCPTCGHLYGEQQKWEARESELLNKITGLHSKVRRLEMSESAKVMAKKNATIQSKTYSANVANSQLDELRREVARLRGQVQHFKSLWLAAAHKAANAPRVGGGLIPRSATVPAVDAPSA